MQGFLGGYALSKDLSIEQAAQLLGVSKDTVRRRIKSGEYQAEKKMGPYGEEWRLAEGQFNQAVESKEIVPMARQVTVAELEQAMQRLMQNAANKAVMQAMHEQTTQIKVELYKTKEELKEELREAKEELIETKETVNSLAEQIEAQNRSLNNHYRLVDERLREISERNKKKTLWSRFFG